MDFFKKQVRALLLSAAVAVGLLCLSGCGDDSGANTGGGSGSFSYGDQTYKTVKIGSRTWMAENLNIETGNSWCYDNDESNCAAYGRLYDWNTAMTVCPTGWRLPGLMEDYFQLLVALGFDEKDGNSMDKVANKLKSKTGWDDKADGSSGNGTDNSGFSALPGSYRDVSGSFGEGDGFSFCGIGCLAAWWTTTQPFTIAYTGKISGAAEMDIGSGLSVRCIAD